MQRMLIAFLLLMISTLGYSQDPVQLQVNNSIPNPVPPSPNVASLGKFIDYPVGYFTSVPDISIPIYRVQSGDLTVPITLSYHASGIKPTDVASWVGMGRSVSAGGFISRNVRGKPDEYSYSLTPLQDNLTVCDNYTYPKNFAGAQQILSPIFIRTHSPADLVNSCSYLRHSRVTPVHHRI
jgi:hypothetical protein